MKHLALLCCTVLCLNAQPNLRIMTGLEGYEDLPGLAGLAPHIGDVRSMTIVNDSPGFKFLLYNLEISNRGNQAFNPSVVPGVVYTNELGHIGLHGFLRVAITNVVTGVGFQRTSDLGIMLWDSGELVPGLTNPVFGPKVPGISVGRVALVEEPSISKTAVNIWGLSGRHTVTFTIDPFDRFGQRMSVRVPVTITGDQLTIDWPKI